LSNYRIIWGMIGKNRGETEAKQRRSRGEEERSEGIKRDINLTAARPACQPAVKSMLGPSPCIFDARRCHLYPLFRFDGSDGLGSRRTRNSGPRKERNTRNTPEHSLAPSDLRLSIYLSNNLACQFAHTRFLESATCSARRAG